MFGCSGWIIIGWDFIILGDVIKIKVVFDYDVWVVWNFGEYLVD